MNMQSVLAPAGVQAAEIERLWWVFLAVSIVVFVLVVAALTAAIARRRHTSEGSTDGTLTRVVEPGLPL